MHAVLALQAEARDLHSRLAAANGQLGMTPDRCRTQQRQLQEEAVK